MWHRMECLVQHNMLYVVVSTLPDPADVWYRICVQRKGALRDVATLELSMQLVLQHGHDVLNKRQFGLKSASFVQHQHNVHFVSSDRRHHDLVPNEDGAAREGDRKGGN